EMYQARLTVGGIDRAGPGGRGQQQPQLDRLAHGATQQVAELLDETARVDDLRPQCLASGEGEQRMRKTRAALGATLCGGQQTFARRADNMPSQQFETAGYDGKQVVEVVGYPAGELPDRLHALCLLQRGFGALALGDFR